MAPKLRGFGGTSPSAFRNSTRVPGEPTHNTTPSAATRQTETSSTFQQMCAAQCSTDPQPGPDVLGQLSNPGARSLLVLRGALPSQPAKHKYKRIGRVFSLGSRSSARFPRFVLFLATSRGRAALEFQAFEGPFCNATSGVLPRRQLGKMLGTSRLRQKPCKVRHVSFANWDCACCHQGCVLSVPR